MYCMGGLLVAKLCLPMLLVCCAFPYVARAASVPRGGLVQMLAMCDVLSINFFLLVRDEGSWKEIGNSISKFVLVNVLSILVQLLLRLAAAITTGGPQRESGD